uniref:Uncharacterized protein n=1 Tax=Candidatus Kentrum sp. FM TaxID=2126340 RepID=A0A450S9B5_9GAMM|nr:MAG: hypothetical protein BECKFM1743C_GA0114222_100618 [Candidatus Kentron sp. FM]
MPLAFGYFCRVQLGAPGPSELSFSFCARVCAIMDCIRSPPAWKRDIAGFFPLVVACVLYIPVFLSIAGLLLRISCLNLPIAGLLSSISSLNLTIAGLLLSISSVNLPIVGLLLQISGVNSSITGLLLLISGVKSMNKSLKLLAPGHPAIEIKSS